MKQKEPQQLLDRESLKNLTPEQLVEMVLKLQKLVVKQGETIEKLKGNLDRVCWKSVLVGLGVRSRSSGVSSRSFQALLPLVFVPVCVLREE